MRINAEELSELCNRQRAVGESVGSLKRESEFAVLLKENAELKYQVASFDSRAKHMEDAAVQRASFPAVRAEQLRIVKTVRKLLPKKLADDLLFLLAMGDIQ